LNNPSAILNNGPVLTPRLLLVLRAVVQRGTLTAAATALGYTVSAVSQQLSQLEREAGSPLLEKAGCGVRPTAVPCQYSSRGLDLRLG